MRCPSLLLSLALALACSDTGRGDAVGDAGGQPPFDAASGTMDAMAPRACERGYDDLVLDAFCREPAPAIRSLADLQSILGIEPGRADATAGYAITGHSTALVTRSVSAINPRVLFVRLEADDEELLALGFARGDTFAEAVVRDRQQGELRFYLIDFELPCEEDSECGPQHLLTPEVERGWFGVALRDEEELANTPLDCLHCHQPNGPGTPKLLRMQEMIGPWTHWFSPVTSGGTALFEDYVRAKGDESFAGLSVEQIRNADPAAMALFVRRGGSPDQPNAFPSNLIESEVRSSAAAAGGVQPEDNSVPGESATWDSIYEVAKQGNAIPVPYHDVKVTDRDKLARMSEAYRDYREGRLAPEKLPDIRDVYPDDPSLLAAMGFTTEPGLPPDAAIVQACAQCHNRRLDQRLSRAAFHVDLPSLSAEQKATAVERLELPRTDPKAMPPPIVRTLSDDVRRSMIDWLRH